MADELSSLNIEREIKLLRDQVDLLQISTAEKATPWYRQVSVVISVLAFLFSVVSAVYAQMSHNAEEVRIKKEELRKAIEALIDLRGDFQTRVMQVQDLLARETAGVTLNAKRGIYVEAARAVADEIPDHVGSAEYIVLAYEIASDSNLRDAERYYGKAVAAASSDLSKIYALRARGQFYFNPGPQKDFEKGRKDFMAAAEVAKNPGDPYMVYTLGVTYEQWGFAEMGNGFAAEGRQKLERARKYYSDLPPNYYLGPQSLQTLDMRLKQIPVGKTQ